MVPGICKETTAILEMVPGVFERFTGPLGRFQESLSLCIYYCVVYCNVVDLLSS